jgi:tetratricopeptide (TPR) repeat protein
MRLLNIVAFFITTSLIIAQPDITPEQWQDDLRFLQRTVNSEYSHLFKKVSKEEWNNAVEKLYLEIPQIPKHEITVGIAEIISKFGYGHTALWLTAWRYNHGVDFHQMPYNLYQFSDGVFVQGVHRDYAEGLGAKVLKVGKIDIDQALELIKPVFPSENDQFFKAHGLHYLGVPEILHAKGVIDQLETVTLTLEKDGRVFEMTFTPKETDQFPGHYGIMQTYENWLDARTSELTPLWLKNLDKKYFYEYLPSEKILYVRQSEVQDEESKPIPDFYDEIFDFVEKNEVEKMVLDLRLNSGGNNYKNKPVVTGVIRCEKINQPGRFYVVLGRRTFSACQNLVNELENYTEAIFVGEPTGENVNFFGDNRTVTLPKSKLPIRLSYLWWQDKDPRDQRPWTPPHIAVDLSSTQYMEGIDPVMDAIKETSIDNPVRDPWNHLVELFTAGEFEELKEQAMAYVKDPTYKYFNFEGRINQAGYDLMGAGRLEEAQGTFMLNTELYPESANCWDSLAECFWKMGDKEKATQHYEKAISMDPDGPVGENARNMLHTMKYGH